MFRIDRHIPALFALMLCMIVATPVFAQNIPSSADPARVQGHIRQEWLPPLEKERSVVKEEAPAATPTPQGAALIRFPLEQIFVDGMTVYKEEDIRPLYQKMIGEDVTLVDIFALADALTVKYRNDGYILTRAVVPAQEIENGTVRLQVVEGYIDAVKIEGDTRAAHKRIRHYLTPVQAARPLNMKQLERALLLINDLPGVTARNILSPSLNTFGAADLTLIVTDTKIFSGNLRADNRGSRYLGPLQVSATVNTENLLKQHDRIFLQSVTALHSSDTREMDYIGAGYSQPVGRFGTILSIGGNISFSEPGYTLTQFNIDGRTDTVNIALTQPLIRSRLTNLSLTGSFDLMNTKRTDNINPAPTEDRLRVLRLAVSGHHFDRFSGVTSGNLQISQGLDILNATETGSANLTRARGVSDFFKATAQIDRLQRVTDRIQFYGAVTGQKSAHMLLSSEEFGIGGADFGRAYDASEITGEDAVAAKAELRFLNPLPLVIKSHQFYGFYDIGKVWDPDNNIVSAQTRSLASAGLGVNMTFWKDVALNIEAAKPLTRPVAYNGSSKWRWFFSLNASF
ncbi:MAG: ShlB/FhaC/HecB family hemolysin secretion/activation protein [Pseudomonadota bacterium]|nr:ShlB/FhaC/HecB family hemolysin secretion/activation protein [Pseudomonadota bacterium]QKK06076.1 MAG: ShlB/FhaC/HecB family hemolysin secretion/activation protein [Pseudomonadota bacterium]